MVVRNPYRPQATGLVRESAGDIFQKELARAGAGLIGGIGQAVIQQPLQQMFGAEGSIGREFVSPEIREMKRQEAESMAAQRVAPYYQAQQQTLRQQMQEAGQTGRTGMTLQGQMEQKQLGEGSDILQLAMKLRGNEEYLKLQYRLKNAAKNAKRPKNMEDAAWDEFQDIAKLMQMSTKGGQQIDQGIRDMASVKMLAWVQKYPQYKSWVNQAGLMGEKGEPTVPGVEVSPALKERETGKQIRAEEAAAAKIKLEERKAELKQETNSLKGMSADPLEVQGLLVKVNEAIAEADLYGVDKADLEQQRAFLNGMLRGEAVNVQPSGSSSNAAIIEGL